MNKITPARGKEVSDGLGAHKLTEGARRGIDDIKSLDNIRIKIKKTVIEIRESEYQVS